MQATEADSATGDTSNTESDSTSEPVCGNGVIEDGEACDAQEGCSGACTWYPGTIIWQRTFYGTGTYDFDIGGDSVSVWQEDGSIIASGQVATGDSSRGGWFSRYSTDGNLLWAHILHDDIDGNTSARANAIRTIDGGYDEFVVAGRYRNRESRWIMWMAAFSSKPPSNAAPIWELEYDAITSAAAATSGALVFDTQNRAHFGGERGGLWVAKYDLEVALSDGSFDNTPTSKSKEIDYVVPHNDPAKSRLGGLALASNGDIIACGYLDGYDFELELGSAWLSRMRPDQEAPGGFVEVFHKTMDNLAPDFHFARCQNISLDENDSILLSGIVSKTDSTPPYRAWVDRFDSEGEHMWESAEAIPGGGAGQSFAEASFSPDGSIVVAMQISTASNGTDAVVRKYSSDPKVPALEWETSFPSSPKDDFARGVGFGPDSSIAVTGLLDGEIMVAKLAP
ncbi:MAG: hypothetical protein H6716_28070 [Polyangiaceae bacterium]|nr:hypothetical protein [Polyangiaceae bacterium]